MRLVRTLALWIVVASSAAAAWAAEPASLTVTPEIAGDTPDGVALRLTFRFAVPPEAQMGVPLAISGSIEENGSIVKHFRYPLDPAHLGSLTAVISVPTGHATIDASAIVPLEEESPAILAKGTTSLDLAKTGKEYVAAEGSPADALLAEGAAIADSGGEVRIVPPRRDVALNLFIVEVETKPPVQRVEFWVEGKKILTRNAAPYRAELDLGALPKRVEVRAVGYDDHGRYIDADAFVVNERETPLEAKITRTDTPDGVAHFKVSVQNPKGTAIRQASLFAGDRKLVTWNAPPYAIAIPLAQLKGVEFVRASVIDETSYEAADLLFLNGERYTESIEVNLVELPVTVTDASGAPVAGLEKSLFHVSENGKPKKISSFNFAANLPIAAGVLIDHSGSMKPRMADTKKGAIEFLRRIVHGGDRAFVGGFAFDPAKLAPFVSDVAALEEQVDAVPEAEGGTSLYDAIVTGLYRFRGVQGRKALIVLTDGEDTTSRVSYDDMLTYVRSARVPIYFIGIALGVMDLSGKEKMKAIAAETGGTAWFIRSVKELPATCAQLERELRSQYLIAYETESSKKDVQYRTVEVTVDRPGVTARTIHGFIP